jgi:hypothetical protein
MAAAVSQPVKGLGSLSHEPPKRAAEYICTRSLQEEVNVARHQRIGIQLDPVGTAHLPQMIQENLKIFRSGEVELPIVAPGHNMHCPLGSIEADAPTPSPSLPIQGHGYLSLFPHPLKNQKPTPIKSRPYFSKGVRYRMEKN